MHTERMEEALGVKTADFDRADQEIEWDELVQLIEGVAERSDVPTLTAAYAIAKAICSYVRDADEASASFFAATLASNCADVDQEVEAARAAREALDKIINNNRS